MTSEIESFYENGRLVGVQGYVDPVDAKDKPEPVVVRFIYPDGRPVTRKDEKGREYVFTLAMARQELKDYIAWFRAGAEPRERAPLNEAVPSKAESSKVLGLEVPLAAHT